MDVSDEGGELIKGHGLGGIGLPPDDVFPARVDGAGHHGLASLAARLGSQLDRNLPGSVLHANSFPGFFARIQVVASGGTLSTED